MFNTVKFVIKLVSRIIIFFYLIYVFILIGIPFYETIHECGGINSKSSKPDSTIIIDFKDSFENSYGNENILDDRSIKKQLSDETVYNITNQNLPPETLAQDRAHYNANFDNKYDLFGKYFSKKK